MKARPPRPARAASARRSEPDDRDALVLRRSPARPQAAVLLLHGGRADGLETPPALNLPALRMRPFATALLRATRSSPVLVGRVRYRRRGWNGERQDTVRDARRALAELRRLAGPVPVVLVGHSMGGRAALRLGGLDEVRAVVALAPWCPEGEPVAHLAGRRVTVLHDESDRVTRAAGSWDLVHRAQEAGARTAAVPMPRGGHTMLRDARRWHRLATGAVLDALGMAPQDAKRTGTGSLPLGSAG
ncbi:alpha/beta hydrolase [Streptomyces diacarni]|uniref:Alpha/beta fold hydrolase n=1 Tax=Streptomyces diacarni TaxID=2800381 RepID=A0A367FB19_9ACTN|nr:alpha/beta hydrolase [Streptomyces diacarni]RCG27139.1 alpha/beta fold hydrolase [Streptomyces diacarni]